jgi:DNA-binding NarL/FixJ family response regulator
VLRGLVDLLADDPQFLVVRSCDDGLAALDAAKELTPDIAIVDFNMPRLNGLEFLKAVRAAQLPTRVVLLTAGLSDSDLFDVMANGPFGLVFKSAAADTLLACIRQVSAGKSWFPAEGVDTAMAREAYRRERGLELWQSLTERERDIAVLAARNHSNREIARILSITEGTAKIHLHNIYSKLHLESRDALAALIDRFFDQMPPGNRHTESY